MTYRGGSRDPGASACVASIACLPAAGCSMFGSLATMAVPAYRQHG